MNRRNRTLIVLLVAVGARQRRDLFRLSRHHPDPGAAGRGRLGLCGRRGRESADGHAADEGAHQARRLAVVEPRAGQLRRRPTRWSAAA